VGSALKANGWLGRKVMGLQVIEPAAPTFDARKSIFVSSFSFTNALAVAFFSFLVPSSLKEESL